jgi:hypothetical protein
MIVIRARNERDKPDFPNAGQLEVTDAQKQPLIVALVLAAVGVGIHLAAQRAESVQQRAAADQAAQLGDVPLHLATTFGQMNGLVGVPDAIVVPISQQGHVITRHEDLREASWHLGLIKAQYRVPQSGKPQSVIPDDALPIQVEVTAPFGGSLDGIRLGGTCRGMTTDFNRLASEHGRLNCGVQPDAVPDSFMVFDPART